MSFKKNLNLTDSNTQLKPEIGCVVVVVVVVEDEDEEEAGEVADDDAKLVEGEKLDSTM